MMKLTVLLGIMVAALSLVACDDAQDKKDYIEVLAGLYTEKELASIVGFVEEHKEDIKAEDMAAFKINLGKLNVVRKGLFALPKIPTDESMEAFDGLYRDLKAIKASFNVLFKKYAYIFNHKEMDDVRKDMQ